MTRTFRTVFTLLALAALPLAGAETIKPFETAALGTNAWYGRFGFTNCAWLDMGDGVLLVDTGANAEDAANLLAEIKRTANKPVKWIVLTHLHQDSNGGLVSFLPADVTVFVNQKAASLTALGLEKRSAPGKHATVVGVADKLTVFLGTHPIEFVAPRGAAHTDYDLAAYAPEMKTAFVGDLVNPGRCPMLSDPAADPKGWLETLDRVLALQPALLIATRGDAAIRQDPKAPKVTGLDLDIEIGNTRAYVDRVVKALRDLKKKKTPDSQVTAELRRTNSKDYCPVELDADNAMALYHRLNAQGEFAAPKAPGAKSAPAAKTTKKK